MRKKKDGHDDYRKGVLILTPKTLSTSCGKCISIIKVLTSSVEYAQKQY